jgi:hypothetical protein
MAYTGTATTVTGWTITAELDPTSTNDTNGVNGAYITYTITGPNGAYVHFTNYLGGDVPPEAVLKKLQADGYTGPVLPPGFAAALVSTTADARNAYTGANPPEVSPTTDPALTAPDSGANATPAEGTTAPDVPAAAQTTDAGATVTPTQGTAPQDIPPDAQGTDAFLGPDVQPPPDDGQNTDSFLGDTNSGLEGEIDNTQNQATLQDSTNFALGRDWRVRLSLAPNAGYLYNAKPAGILQPLQATQGVIFPYTPDIQISYAGNYEPLTLTHSNYKIFQYQSSSVDQIQITCEFTAQDTTEATYLLAVIHFFRSVTKMFYGQDQDPKAGTPPPLCYLHGLGAFQFDNHPLVINNFNYTLPKDVDYIRVAAATVEPGVGTSNGNNDGFNPNPQQLAALRRLGGTIQPGGNGPSANFGTAPAGTVPATYVPTMMNISITAYPIVSRNDISNNFSLQRYATGDLITKGFW